MELEPCPSCGAMAIVGASTCGHCGAAFTRARRRRVEPGRDPAAPPSREPGDRPAEAVGSAEPVGPVAPTESTPRDAVKAVVVAVAVMMALGLIALGGVALVLHSLDQPPSVERTALAADGTWTRFDDPGARFGVDLPCDPRPTDSGEPPAGTVRVRGWRCAYPSTVVGVTWADHDAVFSVGFNARDLLLDTPRRRAEASGATVLESSTTTVDGYPAIEFVLEEPDGRHHAVVAVLVDNRLWFLAVESEERHPAALERLVESFELAEG